MNIIVEPTIFHVKLGGPETTDEIVSNLGFPVNSDITQANFPIQPRLAIKEVEIQIVDPGRSFTENEGLIILADVKLERPTYEHGIRFAEQHGKLTTSSEKPFVLFLHEAWEDPEGARRVLCLFRSPDRHWLHLDCLSIGFFDTCVLAGIKSRK